MYFRFCGWLKFSHNGVIGPESKTTRTFRPVQQVAVPGAKFAISSCMLFLTCFSDIQRRYCHHHRRLRQFHNSDRRHHLHQVVWLIRLLTSVTLFIMSSPVGVRSSVIGVSLSVSLLSTHADNQSVDISFTVCLCVCSFVRLRISQPRINLAASDFARWFTCVLGRESPILGNFAPPKAPPEAPNRTNRPVRVFTNLHMNCTPGCAIRMGA